MRTYIELDQIYDIISKYIIMPTVYSLGLIHADSPYIKTLLDIFPGTILHLYTYSKKEQRRYLGLNMIYGNRVRIIVLSDLFPKFLTLLHDMRYFYDYVIIDIMHSRVTGKQFHCIWNRVRVGGVYVSQDSPILPKWCQKKKFRKGSFIVLPKNKWVVIMACSRGATRYIYDIAFRIGLGIHHERYGPEGIVAGQATGIITPPLTRILHQVREPLASISSLAVRAETFAEYYIDLIGVPYKDNAILWAMSYWYIWHRIADQMAQFTYRVENLHNIWDKFLWHIGMNNVSMPDIPIDTNTHPARLRVYPQVTWDILSDHDITLTDRIRELAIQYGYSI